MNIKKGDVILYSSPGGHDISICLGDDSGYLEFKVIRTNNGMDTGSIWALPLLNNLTTQNIKILEHYNTPLGRILYK